MGGQYQKSRGLGCPDLLRSVKQINFLVSPDFFYRPLLTLKLIGDKNSEYHRSQNTQFLFIGFFFKSKTIFLFQGRVNVYNLLYG